MRFFTLVSDRGEKFDIVGSQPTLVNELAKRVQTWRMLQLDCYADKRLQTQEWSPIIANLRYRFLYLCLHPNPAT